jgi:hypothetical protein
VKKAVKAITDMKKSAKATADVKPLKIKYAPNQADNFEFFSEFLYVFSSPAVSDLQAIKFVHFENTVAQTLDLLKF